MRPSFIFGGLACQLPLTPIPTCSTKSRKHHVDDDRYTYGRK